MVMLSRLVDFQSGLRRWPGAGTRCPHDTNSTFLQATDMCDVPRSEHVYGRARGTSLRSDAALRALGDDRELTEEQLAPLARVHGDAADRAVIDGRRGHGRSLEKVPGKLGRVELGAPEVIVPGNRRRWELLTGVKCGRGQGLGFTAPAQPKSSERTSQEDLMEPSEQVSRSDGTI